MKDAFAVLGIRANATIGEAKKAYRQLSLTKHPDKGGSQEEFHQLQQAWEEVQKIFNEAGSRTILQPQSRPRNVVRRQQGTAKASSTPFPTYPGQPGGPKGGQKRTMEDEINGIFRGRGGQSGQSDLSDYSDDSEMTDSEISTDSDEEGAKGGKPGAQGPGFRKHGVGMQQRTTTFEDWTLRARQREHLRQEKARMKSMLTRPTPTIPAAKDLEWLLARIDMFTPVQRKNFASTLKNDLFQCLDFRIRQENFCLIQRDIEKQEEVIDSVSDFLLNISDELEKEKNRIDVAAAEYKRVRRQVDESWQILLLGRKIESSGGGRSSRVGSGGRTSRIGSAGSIAGRKSSIAGRQSRKLSPRTSAKDAAANNNAELLAQLELRKKQVKQMLAVMRRDAIVQKNREMNSGDKNNSSGSKSSKSPRSRSPGRRSRSGSRERGTSNGTSLSSAPLKREFGMLPPALVQRLTQRLALKKEAEKKEGESESGRKSTGTELSLAGTELSLAGLLDFLGENNSAKTSTSKSSSSSTDFTKDRFLLEIVAVDLFTAESFLDSEKGHLIQQKKKYDASKVLLDSQYNQADAARKQVETRRKLFEKRKRWWQRVRGPVFADELSATLRHTVARLDHERWVKHQNAENERIRKMKEKLKSKTAGGRWFKRAKEEAIAAATANKNKNNGNKSKAAGSRKGGRANSKIEANQNQNLHHRKSRRKERVFGKLRRNVWRKLKHKQRAGLLFTKATRRRKALTKRYGRVRDILKTLLQTQKDRGSDSSNKSGNRRKSNRGKLPSPRGGKERVSEEDQKLRKKERKKRKAVARLILSRTRRRALPGTVVWRAFEAGGKLALLRPLWMQFLRPATASKSDEGGTKTSSTTSSGNSKKDRNKNKSSNTTGNADTLDNTASTKKNNNLALLKTRLRRRPTVKRPFPAIRWLKWVPREKSPAEARSSQHYAYNPNSGYSQTGPGIQHARSSTSSSAYGMGAGGKGTGASMGVGFAKGADGVPFKGGAQPGMHPGKGGAPGFFPGGAKGPGGVPNFGGKGSGAFGGKGGIPGGLGGMHPGKGGIPGGFAGVPQKGVPQKGGAAFQPGSRSNPVAGRKFNTMSPDDVKKQAEELKRQQMENNRSLGGGMPGNTGGLGGGASRDKPKLAPTIARPKRTANWLGGGGGGLDGLKKPEEPELPKGPPGTFADPDEDGSLASRLKRRAPVVEKISEKVTGGGAASSGNAAERRDVSERTAGAEDKRRKVGAGGDSVAGGTQKQTRQQMEAQYRKFVDIMMLPSQKLKTDALAELSIAEQQQITQFTQNTKRFEEIRRMNKEERLQQINLLADNVKLHFELYVKDDAFQQMLRDAGKPEKSSTGKGTGKGSAASGAKGAGKSGKAGKPGKGAGKEGKGGKGVPAGPPFRGAKDAAEEQLFDLIMTSDVQFRKDSVAGMDTAAKQRLTAFLKLAAAQAQAQSAGNANASTSNAAGSSSSSSAANNASAGAAAPNNTSPSASSSTSLQRPKSATEQRSSESVSSDGTSDSEIDTSDSEVQALRSKKKRSSQKKADGSISTKSTSTHKKRGSLLKKTGGSTPKAEAKAAKAKAANGKSTKATRDGKSTASAASVADAKAALARSSSSSASSASRAGATTSAKTGTSPRGSKGSAGTSRRSPKLKAKTSPPRAAKAKAKAGAGAAGGRRVNPFSEGEIEDSEVVSGTASLDRRSSSRESVESGDTGDSTSDSEIEIIR